MEEIYFKEQENVGFLSQNININSININIMDEKTGILLLDIAEIKNVPSIMEFQMSIILNFNG